MTDNIDLIVHSAGQLLTISGSRPKRGADQGDLGIIAQGAVAVSGEQIAVVGATSEVLPLAQSDTQLIDARGGVVLPGFVDAHTHVVFAGDRANEFEMRLSGASYLEIMRAGGGIMNTVRATRAASVQDLVQQSARRLAHMLEHGTTTAEAKTGYGLTTADELKQLKAIAALDAMQPVHLVPTFLGAHAVPEEFRGRADEYVDRVVDEMLPQALAPLRAAGSSFFCDVFCDEGAFTLDQARRILTRARERGYSLKIHADEFANLGGAALAAELGAVSADHLMVTRREEMARMAESDVIAVLLPATTFGLGKFDFANGREFIDANVPVALGSDINPGTSWCESMLMVIAIATRYAKLTPAQAIVASTLNAACATGVGKMVGSLDPGKQADIVIADVPDYRHLAYRYGANPIRCVVKRGRVVFDEREKEPHP